MLGSLVDVMWIVWLLSLVLGVRWVRRGWRGDAVAVRKRGIRRCPKCRHELGDIPTRTCPECGRTAKSERALARPRRAKRKLVAGLVLAVGIGVVLPVYQVARYGWWAIAPDTYLILRLPDYAANEEIVRRMWWWGHPFSGAMNTLFLKPLEPYLMPGGEWHAPWQRRLTYSVATDALGRQLSEDELRTASVWTVENARADAKWYEEFRGLIAARSGASQFYTLFVVVIQQGAHIGRGTKPEADWEAWAKTLTAIQRDPEAEARTRALTFDLARTWKDHLPLRAQHEMIVWTLLQEPDNHTRVEALALDPAFVIEHDVLVNEGERMIRACADWSEFERLCLLGTLYNAPQLRRALDREVITLRRRLMASDDESRRLVEDLMRLRLAEMGVGPRP